MSAGAVRDVPFFAAPGGDPSAARLLLLSDQFPPAQSAGALRWQKLSAFAAERGWLLDVITRDPATLGARDDSRLAELPAGTRVYGLPFAPVQVERVEARAGGLLRRARGLLRRRSLGGAGSATAGASGGSAAPSVAPEAIAWRGLQPRSWLRAYWSWLDYHRQGAWAGEIAALGRRIAAADPGRHVGVVSCGPWHFCNHEAGRRLAGALRLPFVMDLRDPWSLERRVSEQIASPVWFALARRHERRAVAAAALVVVNAEPVRRAMAERYPEAADRIRTITNGYDDEAMPATEMGDRFTIAYAGGIYLDRDPRPVFRAARLVIQALGLTPAQFGVELIGNVDGYGGVPIDRMAEEEGIGAYVRTGPARPRQEALEFLAGAAMLLSLPQDSPWAIPSKIFEYMQFEAWMLVMAEPDAPAALLLEGTSADVVRPTDVDAMAAAIRRRYTAFAAGERPRRIGEDARFSRRTQARLLMDAMAACLTTEPRGGRAASVRRAALAEAR